MAVFAHNGADRFHKWQQRARFVRRGGKQNLQSGIAHELEGAGSAGGIHLAEGFIEERQADSVGRARLVEAVGLGKGGRHRHVEGGGGLAAALFGVDLAQQSAVVVGVVNADIVLQVGAVILQLVQFGSDGFAALVVGGQAFEQQIPGLLVFLAEIRVEQRRAEDILAVHHHIVHGAQAGGGLGDEFVAFAAETQLGQGAVEISQLLAGFLDLLA